MPDTKTQCLKQTRKTIIEYLDGVWDGGKDGWSAVVKKIDDVLEDGGAVVTQTLTLSPDELGVLNSFLELTEGIKDQPEILATYTVDFGNGIEADIKVVNGCEDSGPYVDPVLFRDGNEVVVIEAADQLDGEYVFWYDDKQYIAIVRGG